MSDGADSDKIAMLQDLVEPVDSTVPRGVKSALYELLFQFRDAFSFSDDERGRTSVRRHSIVTGDARPVR